MVCHWVNLLANTLSVIEDGYKGDTGRCLLEVLTKWITRVDKVDDKGGPTWISLTNSLRSIEEVSVADNIDLESKFNTDLLIFKIQFYRDAS